MRAFVAVDITDTEALGLIRTLQGGLGAGCRPVRPENLHFTLQFLGDIPQDMAGEAMEALQGVEFGGFDVELCGIGAFPSTRRPRTVWVGAGSGGRELAELASRVREALSPLGVKARRFSPHLTILRVKKSGRDMTGELDAARERRFGVQHVSGFKLKQSVLGPSGPDYTDLCEVPAA